jgi:hypothetical protein
MPSSPIRLEKFHSGTLAVRLSAEGHHLVEGKRLAEGMPSARLDWTASTVSASTEGLPGPVSWSWTSSTCLFPYSRRLRLCTWITDYASQHNTHTLTLPLAWGGGLPFAFASGATFGRAINQYETFSAVLSMESVSRCLYNFVIHVWFKCGE